MNIQQKIEEKHDPDFPKIAALVGRTLLGVAFAAFGGFMIWKNLAPAWMGLLLIFLGGFFVSQRLITAFVETVLDPLRKALGK
jgi:hypothetical protein